VAALTALYYGEAYPQHVAYIGLGTPRVGDEAFKQKFDAVVMDRTRIANRRDPGMFSFMLSIRTSFDLAKTRLNL